MADATDTIRKKLAELEKRAETLEKRYDRLLGKAEAFTPKATAIDREGIPLEIFCRLALLENGFEVFGLYHYDMHDRERGAVERSADVYAAKDSVYTVPADGGPRAGESWAERNHLLVESKQRRDGVEWIFCALPTSRKIFSVAGKDVPVANTAFELRQAEGGGRAQENPNAIANAIAQLNQAYIPFQLGLENGAEIEWPGRSRQYASPNRKDATWLLLITNAELQYFEPPNNFTDMGQRASVEEAHFRKVPWIVFQPEATSGLRYHQLTSIRLAATSEDNPTPPRPQTRRFKTSELMAKFSHEVHVVNFAHLSTFLELVADPPRLKSIQISLSSPGQPPSTFEIKP